VVATTRSAGRPRAPRRRRGRACRTAPRVGAPVRLSTAGYRAGLVAEGLDAFADKVVPLLQEQGVFRTEYEGPTLCHQLGLAHPDDDRGARRAA